MQEQTVQEMEAQAGQQSPIMTAYQQFRANRGVVLSWLQHPGTETFQIYLSNLDQALDIMLLTAQKGLMFSQTRDELLAKRLFIRELLHMFKALPSDYRAEDKRRAEQEGVS